MIYAVRADDNSWILSKDPLEAHRLSKETAEYYASCINGYEYLRELVGGPPLLNLVQFLKT